MDNIDNAEYYYIKNNDENSEHKELLCGVQTGYKGKNNHFNINNEGDPRDHYLDKNEAKQKLLQELGMSEEETKKMKYITMCRELHNNNNPASVDNRDGKLVYTGTNNEYIPKNQLVDDYNKWEQNKCLVSRHYDKTAVTKKALLNEVAKQGRNIRKNKKQSCVLLKKLGYDFADNNVIEQLGEDDLDNDYCSGLPKNPCNKKKNKCEWKDGGRRWLITEIFDRLKKLTTNDKNEELYEKIFEILNSQINQPEPNTLDDFKNDSYTLQNFRNIFDTEYPKNLKKISELTLYKARSKLRYPDKDLQDLLDLQDINNDIRNYTDIKIRKNKEIDYAINDYPGGRCLKIDDKKLRETIPQLPIEEFRKKKENGEELSVEERENFINMINTISEEHENEISELNEKIEKLEQSNPTEQNSEQINKLEQQIKKLYQDKEQLDQEKKQLEQEKIQLALDKENLEIELKKSNEQISKLEQDIVKLKSQQGPIDDKEIEKLQKKLQECESKLLKSQLEFAEMKTNDDKDLKNEIEEQKKQIEELNNQVEKLEKESNNLKKQLAESNKTLTDAQKELDNAKKELEELKKNNFSTNDEKIEQLNKELQKYKTALDDTKKKLKENNNKNLGRLTKSLLKTKRQINSVHKYINELKLENKKLKEKNDDVQKTITDLIKKLKITEGDLSKMRESGQEQNEEKNEKINKLEDTNEKLKDDLRNLKFKYIVKLTNNEINLKNLGKIKLKLNNLEVLIKELELEKSLINYDALSYLDSSLCLEEEENYKKNEDIIKYEIIKGLFNELEFEEDSISEGAMTDMLKLIMESIIRKENDKLPIFFDDEDSEDSKKRLEEYNNMEDEDKEDETMIFPYLPRGKNFHMRLETMKKTKNLDEYKQEFSNFGIEEEYNKLIKFIENKFIKKYTFHKYNLDNKKCFEKVKPYIETFVVYLEDNLYKNLRTKKN